MLEYTLTIRIILKKPAVGLLYGVQKGSGNSYETLQKQIAGSGDSVFDLSLPVKANKDGWAGVAWATHTGLVNRTVSMMPPGLFDTLTNSKITDLVAYQRTAGPQKQAEWEVS